MTDHNEREAIDVLKYGVEHFHPAFGVGVFFTPDAVESFTAAIALEASRPSPAAVPSTGTTTEEE